MVKNSEDHATAAKAPQHQGAARRTHSQNRLTTDGRDDHEVLMHKATQIVCLICGWMICGCTTRDKAPRAAPHIRARLGWVTFDDGVNRHEAHDLAWKYFHNVYGGCGALGSAQDQGGSWYFPCYVGYAGTEKPGIAVAKQGCRISCASGPQITDPTYLTNPKDPVWRHTKWDEP
jgi:hypothetical protein